MESCLRSEKQFDLLQLNGEVDLQYSPALRKLILASLSEGKPLLIDMADVSYIHSSGIASLVEGFQTAKSAQLPYGLLNASEATRQVLTLTRLDKIFTLFENVEQFRKLL